MKKTTATEYGILITVNVCFQFTSVYLYIKMFIIGIVAIIHVAYMCMVGDGIEIRHSEKSVVWSLLSVSSYWHFYLYMHNCSCMCMFTRLLPAYYDTSSQYSCRAGL